VEAARKMLDFFDNPVKKKFMTHKVFEELRLSLRVFLGTGEDKKHFVKLMQKDKLFSVDDNKIADLCCEMR
jgi:transcriptional regulator of NAD metabolism